MVAVEPGEPFRVGERVRILPNHACVVVQPARPPVGRARRDGRGGAVGGRAGSRRVAPVPAAVRPRPAPKRFSRPVLDAIAKGQVIGIRAGRAPHRFIGIWAVVADGRVFVRSWSRKPRSWWRTFLLEPRGRITVGTRELAVRAVQTRSERTKEAVDRASARSTRRRRRCATCGTSSRSPCRDTTTELVPLR